MKQFLIVDFTVDSGAQLVLVHFVTKSIECLLRKYDTRLSLYVPNLLDLPFMLLWLPLYCHISLTKTITMKQKRIAVTDTIKVLYTIFSIGCSKKSSQLEHFHSV